MRIVCVLWGEGDAPKLPMPCIRVRDLSAVNDLVRRTDCDVVLFLRAGLRPLDTDWVSELMQYAQRADVGCVGSALLDDRDCFRHAGYAVGRPRRRGQPSGGAVALWAAVYAHRPHRPQRDGRVQRTDDDSARRVPVRWRIFAVPERPSRRGFGAEMPANRAAQRLHAVCADGNGYAAFAAAAVPDAGRTEGGFAPLPPNVGEHPPERYYSPLFRPDGSMFIDLDRQEGTP